MLSALPGGLRNFALGQIAVDLVLGLERVSGATN